MMHTQVANCRTNFTEDQKDRMNETLLLYRSELLKYLVYLENSVNSSNAGGTLHVESTSYNSGERAPVDEGIFNIGTNNERFANYQGSGITYKHINWNQVSNDFLLSRNITISNDDEQVGIFPPLQPITIRNVIDDMSFNDGVPIGFNDPWYVKDATNNQSGMGDFIYPLSPYYPTGKYNETSGGVFLNQGYPNWDPPYYSVKVPLIHVAALTQTGRTHRFYFQNWGITGGASLQQVGSNPPGYDQKAVVFTGSGATVKANLKGTQLSNDDNAYSNNSQRKFVKTPDGHLHSVYCSMDRVWYERSTDGGTSWELMQSGNPLDNGEGKHPSIDYLPDDNNYGVIIAFQEKDGNNYKIVIRYYPSGAATFADELNSSVAESYNNNVTPLISVDSHNDFTILWKQQAGFYVRTGYIGGDEFLYFDDTQSTYLTETNSYMTNPAITANKNSPHTRRRLVWEAPGLYNTTDIYFGALDGTDLDFIQNISNGNGYPVNYSPSISVADNKSIVSWTGYYGSNASKILAKETEALYRYK